MIVLSAIVSLFDVSVVHPATKETLKVKSLISGEGLKFMLTSMLENFTGFKPLGLVLAMVLGIGLTQRVGLFESVITKTIIKAHKSVITYTVFFIGIMANIASNLAFVIIPPLAAVVFYSIGRNPIAGLVLVLPVRGGFTANILIAGTDALLSGISTEVAHTIDANASVSPVDNWYFMSVSTIVLTIVGGLVTEKFIEPRLGTYDGETGKRNSISRPMLLRTKHYATRSLSPSCTSGLWLLCCLFRTPR